MPLEVTASTPGAHPLPVSGREIQKPGRLVSKCTQRGGAVAAAASLYPREIPLISEAGHAVSEHLGDGIIVFDAEGRLVFANEPALRAITNDNGRQSKRMDALRPRLELLGANVTPLVSTEGRLGDLVVLPRRDDTITLAERERQAILDTLQQMGGRLAETARRLGVSRTTLWRRLRTYRVRIDGNGSHARHVPPAPSMAARSE